MQKQKISGKSNFGLYGWILVIYAFLVYAASGCQNQTFSIMNDFYTNTLGWTNTQQQLIVSLSQLVCVVVMAIIGNMVRKVSPRKTAFVLLLASAVLFYICSYIETYVLFAIIYVITRCIAQTCSMQLNGVFVGNWFPKKRGLVIGWATCGQALATSISTILMGWGLRQFGIHGSYATISVLSLICAFIVLFALRDYPEELGKHPDNDPNEVRMDTNALRNHKTIWTTKRVLATKEFWCISLSVSFMVFGAGFMTQIVPVLMSNGFAPTSISTIMILIGICACFGSYLFGLLDVKVGTKTAMILTGVLLILMGVLVNIGGMVFVVIALICLAMMLGAGSNYCVSMVSGCWGREHFNDVLRYAMPITVLISGIAPTVIAAVAEHFGSYNASFVLAAITGVISILLILPVKPGFAAKKEALWAGKDVSTVEK